MNDIFHKIIERILFNHINLFLEMLFKIFP